MGVDDFNSPRQGPGTDLGEIVTELLDETFQKGPHSIARTPRQYILSRTLTPQTLEALGDVSFENSMYEAEGALILATGSKKSTDPNYFPFPQTSSGPTASAVEKAFELSDAHRTKSRFRLHNHPPSSAISFFGADVAVSEGDLVATENSDCEIYFVLTNKGIVGYEKQLPRYTMGLPAHMIPPRSDINPLGGSNKIISKQLSEGITRFFAPFRGDEESQTKLALICRYINDPNMKWSSIKERIET